MNLKWILFAQFDIVFALSMLMPNLMNPSRILDCEMVVQMVMTETYLLPILRIDAKTDMQSSINLLRMCMATGECILGLPPRPHASHTERDDWCMRMVGTSTKFFGRRAERKALGGISSSHKAIFTRASIEAISGIDLGGISGKMDDTLRVPTRKICVTE